MNEYWTAVQEAAARARRGLEPALRGEAPDLGALATLVEECTRPARPGSLLEQVAANVVGDLADQSATILALFSGHPVTPAELRRLYAAVLAVEVTSSLAPQD